MKIYGYTQTGSIDAIIDGLRMNVPDDMGNRHRRVIAEWEAEGNTIPAYQPPAPSTDPNDYPLNRFQFEAFAMAGLGLTFADIEAAIKALALPTFDEAVALSRLRNSSTYNRNHPLIGQLAGPLGKTDAEIEAAWMLAKDLK